MITSPDTIRHALSFVPPHDRDLWLRMGMAAKAELGDDAFSVWDEWGQQAENYNARDAQSVWRSIKADGKVTGGTLVYEAKARGFVPGKDSPRIDPAEIERHKKERAVAIAKEAAERKVRQDKAADQAEAIFARTLECNSHAYLTRKKLNKPFGARIYKGGLAIDGMRCDGALVIPIRSMDAAIRSLQFIGESGEKRYLPGGEKSGCYFSIGKPDGLVCIVEGFATGVSIHEATGNAVAVAFDATNLLPVSLAMRSRFPDAKLIIGADNDQWTKGNPGATKARAAAEAVGGLLAIPEFSDLSSKPTDFNDMHQQHGLEAVRAALETAATVTPDQIQHVAEASRTTRETHVLSVLSVSSDGPGWENPEPLPDDLPDIDEFDPDLLPDSIRGWVSDISDRVQCPPDFPAVGAVIGLATTAGRKVAIRPKQRDDWHEVGNLWGCIIGKPGVLKTPALSEALRPLHRLEAKAREEFEAEVSTWRIDQEVAKLNREAARQNAVKAAKAGNDFKKDGLVLSEDNEPTARRYIVNDTSVEALGEILRSNENGVCAYRDELRGLLQSLDKEGNEGARAFYLSAWTGKEAHTFDRIGRGLNLRVDATCISMLGSIQPSVMASYLRAAVENSGDDGLLSRFQLLVWPNTSGTWRNVDRFPDTASRQRAVAVFEKLDKLDPLQFQYEDGAVPFLRFSPGAQEVFNSWREGFETRLRSEGEHAAFICHLSKYRKLIPTLALLFQLSQEEHGSDVSEASLLRAMAWAEYLETHAKRAYASVSRRDVSAARALLFQIRRREIDSGFSARTIYRKCWGGLTGSEEIKKALEVLDGYGYVRTDRQQTGGRDAVIYHVNPRVFQ